jgi:hypothetical protein
VASSLLARPFSGFCRMRNPGPIEVGFGGAFGKYVTPRGCQAWLLSNSAVALSTLAPTRRVGSDSPRRACADMKVRQRSPVAHARGVTQAAWKCLCIRDFRPRHRRRAPRALHRLIAVKRIVSISMPIGNAVRRPNYLIGHQKICAALRVRVAGRPAAARERLARHPLFTNRHGLYGRCRRKPTMAINGRRNKPFGPGGSTRRLHRSLHPPMAGFGGGETGSTRA